MAAPRIATRAEWLESGKQLLDREKVLTRQRDRVNAELRQLPWVKVDREYIFDTSDTSEGREALADLFEGRSRLVARDESADIFHAYSSDACAGKRSPARACAWT
ncbi:MAG: DUF899 family protein [Chloroflexota bacterium]